VSIHVHRIFTTLSIAWPTDTAVLHATFSPGQISDRMRGPNEQDRIEILIYIQNRVQKSQAPTQGKYLRFWNPNVDRIANNELVAAPFFSKKHLSQRVTAHTTPSKL
jgi:hypothetical protein